MKTSERPTSYGGTAIDQVIAFNLLATITTKPTAAIISQGLLSSPSMVSVLLAIRAIPLTFDHMIDHRLDLLTRDRISFLLQFL